MEIKVDEKAKENVIFPDSIIGKELGFTSDKFEGYLWRDGSTMTISLITSKYPSQGNFRKLIDDIKEKYDTIFIPVPSNKMTQIATKIGFNINTFHFTKGGVTDSVSTLIWRKDGNEQEDGISSKDF